MNLNQATIYTARPIETAEFFIASPSIANTYAFQFNHRF